MMQPAHLRHLSHAAERRSLRLSFARTPSALEPLSIPPRAVMLPGSMLRLLGALLPTLFSATPIEASPPPFRASVPLQRWLLCPTGPRRPRLLREGPKNREGGTVSLITGGPTAWFGVESGPINRDGAAYLLLTWSGSSVNPPRLR